MLYAIVSDIHANATALKAVLRDIEKRNVDRKVCLGDIIGYCSDSSESIALIHDFDIILMGNHDCAIYDKELVEKFNFHARLAMEKTDKNITDSEKAFLKNLKYLQKENDITFAHSSPRHPEGWGYVVNIDDALDAFKYFDTQLCFIGHTHYPIVVSDEGIIIHEKKYTLEDDKRYVINVGSVGQPRDGDTKACYLLYDSKKSTIEYIRVKYDIAETQRRMKNLKFPKFLINRLSEGR